MHNMNAEDTAKQLQKLEVAVNACEDLIYITDARGRINYVNAAFENITGWQRDEVLGKNPSILESLKSTKKLKEEIWETLGRNETWTGRLLNLRKTRSTANPSNPQSNTASTDYWVHASITPILEKDGLVSGYISIQRDISAQVKKEKKLALETEADRIRTRILETVQQKKPLRQRFNHLLDILFLIQDLDEQKRAAIFLLQEDSQQLELFTLRGKFSDTFIKCNNRVSTQDSRFGQEIEQGKIGYIDECCCDNSSSIEHGHYIVPLIHAGHVLGILLLFTKIKPNQDPIRTAFLSQLSTTLGLTLADEYLRDELTKARNTALDTVRIKSEFISNISHELRTPINGIQGMLELLNDSELDDEQLMFVAVAQSATSDLLAVINDVLDFSELDTAQMEIIPKEFCIRDLIQEIIQEYTETAQKRGINFVSNVAQNIPNIVHADPQRIKQNLGNYINNAIKFSESGQIGIDIDYKQEARGNFLKLSVTDNGIGIAAEHQSTLFQSFTQGDGSSRRKHGGTGLGLAIVSKLTEMMGGRCGMESTLGQGSTFWFSVLLHENRQSISAVEPINEKTLEGLRESMGEDFVTIKNAFLDEFQDLITRCEQALDKQDTNSSQNILCNLKTACKELGATELLNSVEELETNIANNPSSPHRLFFKSIQQAYQNLIRYFETKAA